MQKMHPRRRNRLLLMFIAFLVPFALLGYTTRENLRLKKVAAAASSVATCSDEHENAKSVAQVADSLKQEP